MFFLELLRPSVSRATRPQVLCLAAPPSQALPSPLISLHRFFADWFHVEFTMTRTAPLLHQTNCPTLLLRLPLATAWRPVSFGFTWFGRNLTYTSVSCAQISSELRHFCMSDGHTAVQTSVAQVFLAAMATLCHMLMPTRHRSSLVSPTPQSTEIWMHWCEPRWKP